jgi:hypothetical protein
MKLDMIKINENVLIHKQIEKRDGKVFMRIRKRPIVMIR